jgi:ketosteroid isomerase-like protein
MFVTIRRYQLTQPAQIEEVVRRVEKGLFPIVARQPGFVSYAGVDAGQGQELSISVYRDRAAAEAANQAAAAWVKANLADLLGPAEVTTGERVVAASPEDENVAIVRQGYEAFGRNDLPALLDLLDPHVSWTTPGPADLSTAGVRTGHAAVAEFFQRLSATIDMLRFEPKQFIAQGDQVVVIGDDTSRVKATGNTVEFRWTHVFTLRLGKVIAFEEIGDVTPLVSEIRAAQAKL